MTFLLILAAVVVLVPLWMALVAYCFAPKWTGDRPPSETE
jgi:hypothetical protein